MKGMESVEKGASLKNLHLPPVKTSSGSQGVALGYGHSTMEKALDFKSPPSPRAEGPHGVQEEPFRPWPANLHSAGPGLPGYVDWGNERGTIYLASDSTSRPSSSTEGSHEVQSHFSGDESSIGPSAVPEYVDDEHSVDSPDPLTEEQFHSGLTPDVKRGVRRGAGDSAWGHTQSSDIRQEEAKSTNQRPDKHKQERTDESNSKRARVPTPPAAIWDFFGNR
ncbi:hypothetical protein CROQUDRAFT_650183 [Cronartium quercuum f. sp. fusiforme G11]|uniref:Uncharacterized protein n=1 Tax=Cronartium quercuum f. sp. fusiforme G11 TaxID=708437 RepID=A0A9P6NRN4_9BASI|nr:hypothetical protein CROQUDRAFT_650183 [Cronartium quercuum f. sp. fusiforme G11]